MREATERDVVNQFRNNPCLDIFKAAKQYQVAPIDIEAILRADDWYLMLDVCIFSSILSLLPYGFNCEEHYVNLYSTKCHLGGEIAGLLGRDDIIHNFTLFIDHLNSEAPELWVPRSRNDDLLQQAIELSNLGELEPNLPKND